MKELIDKLSDLASTGSDASDAAIEHVCGRAIAALEAAEAREAEMRKRVAELEGMVPRWVPVSERLPECEVDVLTFSVDHPEDGIVLESRISDCDWTTTLGEPTHWMPLPAVPKGGVE